jgi:3-deoxy-D-manno-octulosonic-acid transferase
MGAILFIVYNTIVPFLIVLSFPLSLILPTKSFTPRLWLKRIFPDIKTFKDKTILFHCSSIGEINSVRTLIDYFKKSEPNTKIIITTFTETANNIAKKITEYSYILPFDFYPIMKRFIKKANPKIVFIAETEIWPSFIRISSKKSKLYYINARISDKSFKFYKYLSPLIKYCFKNIEKIFVQDKEYYDKFSFFYDSKKIVIAGNTKYDLLDDDIKAKDLTEILKKIDFLEKKLITFGSIHPDEIEIIIKSYKLIVNDINDIRYIIVPRHIEKTKEFEEIIKRHNLNYQKLSDIKQKEDRFKDFYDTQILLVDEVGSLLDFYSVSDICFVGGTLNKTGGHNLLEPSVFSKPVLFGPNYLSQGKSAKKLIEYGGGFIVNDEQDLKSRIKFLISDKNYYLKASENSKKALLSLKGATEKIKEWIG